jgi:hypothetical protein
LPSRLSSTSDAGRVLRYTTMPWSGRWRMTDGASSGPIGLVSRRPVGSVSQTLVDP